MKYIYTHYLFIAMVAIGMSAATAQNTTLYQSNYDGSFILCQAGGLFFVNGHMETQSYIQHAGTCIITGNIINNGDSTGFVTVDDGIVKLINDTAHQAISGSKEWEFKKLEIDNPADVYQYQNIRVTDTLLFTRGNYYLQYAYIDLGFSGAFAGEREDAHIYTTDGYIVLNKNIQFPSDNTNISGIGLYIGAEKWNFGNTTIYRRHVAPAKAGRASIQRVYEFHPSMSTPLDNSTKEVQRVKLAYFQNEAALLDESALEFFTRKHNSPIWMPAKGSADATANIAYTPLGELGHEYITLGEVPDNNSCPESHPQFVEARYLVASSIYVDTSAYFVNLSVPHPDSIRNAWDLGDSTATNLVHPIKKYDQTGTYITSLTASNDYCFSSASKYIQVLPSNKRFIPDSSSTSDAPLYIRYYPNPTYDLVQIRLDLAQQQPATLVLYDMLGNKLFEKKYDQKNITDTYPMHRLAPGVYIVQLHVNGQKLVHKIIKL